MTATESSIDGVVDLRTNGLVVAQPAATVPETTVVVRHVEIRSVFRISALFYLCVCVVLLVALVLLWMGAAATGVLGNVESFLRDAGFEDFHFLPGEMLRAVCVAGLVLVAAGTAANVLLAMLFNLMSDVVGGVRVTLAGEPPRE